MVLFLGLPEVYPFPLIIVIAWRAPNWSLCN